MTGSLLAYLVFLTSHPSPPSETILVNGTGPEPLRDTDPIPMLLHATLLLVQAPGLSGERKLLMSCL